MEGCPGPRREAARDREQDLTERSQLAGNWFQIEAIAEAARDRRLVRARVPRRIPPPRRRVGRRGGARIREWRICTSGGWPRDDGRGDRACVRYRGPCGRRP